MNALDKLIDMPTAVVSVAGEDITITPLRVGQLPSFFKAVKPIIGSLTQESINWIAILSDYGDAIITAISIAIKKDREWVEALATDEAMLLAAKVIEVNSDFFMKAVMPKINALIIKTKEGKSETGDMQSNS